MSVAFQDDNVLHIKVFFNIIWQVPETGGSVFYEKTP